MDEVTLPAQVIEEHGEAIQKLLAWGRAAERERAAKIVEDVDSYATGAPTFQECVDRVAKKIRGTSSSLETAIAIVARCLVGRTITGLGPCSRYRLAQEISEEIEAIRRKI